MRTLLIVCLLFPASQGIFDWLWKRGTAGECECGDWHYVEQCGHDCRQYRWRSCEPSDCAVEDERAPCFTVEWGEWSGCDRLTCTRTRKQNCCCNTAIVSPDICMVELQTETENCQAEKKTGDWTSCDGNCQRARATQCFCVDPGSEETFPISEEKCGLRPGSSVEVAGCPVALEWAEWSECDNMCMMQREASCQCDDPNGQRFAIRAASCNIQEGHSETRSCQSEWGDWVHLQECPARLPVNQCHVYVKRFRQCTCVREDTSKFVVGDPCCGREPSKQSVACTNIPEKCSCMVMPGTPAICPRTCDAAVAGMRVEGSPPICSCTPEWYTAACDPNLMKPDYKICRPEPSQWSEWGVWSSCGRSCTQHRTRKCQCYDGKIYHESDESRCPGGNHYETRDCPSEWGDWVTKPCPDQNLVKLCEIRSKEYRQCFCQSGENVALGPDRCEGEHMREFDCPVDPCNCHWYPVTPPCEEHISRSCDAHPVYFGARCECTPYWYKGACPEAGDKALLASLKPRMCPPSEVYTWESWLPWSPCNGQCKRTRVRKCVCPANRDIDLERCVGDYIQTQDCPVEWTEWRGGCQEEQCQPITASRYRSCHCKSNPVVTWTDPAEIAEKCGALLGGTSQTVSCPAKPFAVTEWTHWPKVCDMNCDRSRRRECLCVDAAGSHSDQSQCPVGTLYHEKRPCETEWSDWSKPDCGEPTCNRRVRPIYKYCMCKGRDFSVSRERCPGKPFELAVKCPTLPEEQCRDCSCSDWECGEDCHSMSRECTNNCDYEWKAVKESCCTDCQCSEWQCKDTCDATMIRSCPDSCDIEEKAIEGPCCVVDNQPQHHDHCTCSEWQCKDTCDATMIRFCPDSCDIEEKAIAEPCCVVDNQPQHHDHCTCSEWHCKDSCDATMIRDCHDHCDIEEKDIAEPCCELETTHPPHHHQEECVCSEWRCHESCDATMVRDCPDSCGIERKRIAEPCCVKEEEEEEERCICSEWRCKDSCDATMIRNCLEDCDIEEKAIEGPCCRSQPEPCVCSEWQCKDSCDATMVRHCHGSCDIEEKPIAEPCCEPTVEAGTGCECGAWVGVSCSSDSERGCVEEQWRSCSPEHCDLQARNSTDTDCCEEDNVIPGDCSECGKWINVGRCREGEEGTHQWRSVRNCDRSTCDEFRCVPEGKHCQEELCGEWFDIGDCSVDGESGRHQWRSAEECYCEPYRCYIEEDSEIGELMSSCEAQCTEWKDDTGCDDNCVNTEKRTCDSGSGCAEYRIQAGYCCLKEN